MRMDGVYSSITELERFFEEKKAQHEEKDVLMWWKIQNLRYPILSRMARDILAVSVSTVASESTFSAGGHHLDQFRSSLTPKILKTKLMWRPMWYMLLEMNDGIEVLKNEDVVLTSM